MSECCKPNRRALLTGAAAAATGMAALPAVAGPHEWSPEFREWMALAKTVNEVGVAYNVWEAANPLADSATREEGSPYSRFNRELEKLEWAIYRKPVRSWADVGELGMIALFWTATDLVHPDEDPSQVDQFALGRDPNMESEYQGERPAAFLTQAVARLIMGGSS